MGAAFLPNAKIRIALFSSAATFHERDFFDAENASAFSISFSEEEKKLADFRTGTGGVDASVKRITDMTGAIDLRHFTPANLALITWGSTAALAATPVVDEAGYKARPGAFTPCKRIINTTVAPVLKKGATTILAADYTVTAGGIQWSASFTTAGLVSGDSITIGYTPSLGADVQALISAAPDVSISVEGINQVDGKYFVARIYKAKLGALQNLPFIADDFSTASVSFTAQTDSTIVTAGKSQYAEMHFNA